MVSLHRRKHKHGTKKKDKHRQSNIDQGQQKLYVQLTPMANETKTLDPKLSSIVYVNDEMHPIPIDNEWFTGLICIRVRDYGGWTPLGNDDKPRPKIPTLRYFDGHKRAFALQVLGRFKKPLNGDDLMFGTWFEKELKLPRGYSFALRFMKYIDASMEYNIHNTTKPYMCSPLVCAMNTVSVVREGVDEQYSWREMKENDWVYYNGKYLEENLPLEANNPGEEDASVEEMPPPLINVDTFTEEQLTEMDKKYTENPKLNGGVGNWIWSKVPYFGSTPAPTPPSSQNAHSATPTPAYSAQKRRKYYLHPDRRKSFTYKPDTVYSFEFFSPYVDVNNMRVNLGISIDVSYYLNDQPITYYARLRNDPNSVLFKIEIGMQ